MDEIDTTDIEGFKLPSSGTIKLSEIKGEFNKGNNLTAYYGVVSGIPSSGAIKLTDFYGKEQGGGGGNLASEGNYRGAGTNIVAAEGDYYLWTAAGTGRGTYYPFPSNTGVTALQALGSYNDLAKQSYKFAFAMDFDSNAVPYYNQYADLRVETPYTRLLFRGTWRRFTRNFISAGRQEIMEFSNPDAGAAVARAINGGDSWFAGLATPTKEGLEVITPIINFESSTDGEK